MIRGEAFQIARVDVTEGGLVAVSGRAYRELHVGDVLRGNVAGPNGVEQPAKFTIESISTYGRTVQSLGQMLTGVLILRGGDGRLPRAESALVTKRRTRDEAVAQRGGAGTDRRR